ENVSKSGSFFDFWRGWTLPVFPCCLHDHFARGIVASGLITFVPERECLMPTRLDGFYCAQWAGLNPSGGSGQGVAFVKDGKVYGGDHVSFFLGTFEDHGNVVTARVGVFPLGGPYRSVTGVVDAAPWNLTDIKGAV